MYEGLQMKLVRFGLKGQERPGVLDDSGDIRDVSAHVGDYDPTFFRNDGVQKIRSLDLKACPVVPGNVRLGACVAQPGNFLAIGLNYVQHAIETNAEIPKDPIIFNKAPSCVSGPNDDVTLPPTSHKTDWEVELAIVIGRKALLINESDALSYVAGFCICNDLSEREFQLERSGQWTKGKMFPTFGPLGPWLVTPDEIGDIQNLHLWLELNGKRIQDSNTSDMIFSIKKIISDVSQYVELQPGDVITTGTPPGVGLGMKPPSYLKPGDRMVLGIQGLGEQRQNVVRWS
jgi:2-keto-4-pentenoate hydratase/2-oxohepta-3-ene-1,7-dioic acid hydratase in catechol pathway